MSTRKDIRHSSENKLQERLQRIDALIFMIPQVQKLNSSHLQMRWNTWPSNENKLQERLQSLKHETWSRQYRRCILKGKREKT